MISMIFKLLIKIKFGIKVKTFSGLGTLSANFGDLSIFGNSEV